MLTLATLAGGCVPTAMRPWSPPPPGPAQLGDSVRLHAPRWAPGGPFEGRLLDWQGDSVWIAPPGGGPAPLGIPAACVTQSFVWREGSRTASASRGAFIGTVIGAAVGLLVTPEPTAWKLQSLPFAAPALATGVSVGVSLGWSRNGGTWDGALLPAADAGPRGACIPKPLPKPPEKPAPKGKAAAPARKPG